MPTAKEELQKAIRDNNPGAINEALDRIRAEKRPAAMRGAARPAYSAGPTGRPLQIAPKPPTAPTPAQSAKPTASAPRTAYR